MLKIYLRQLIILKRGQFIDVAAFLLNDVKTWACNGVAPNHAGRLVIRVIKVIRSLRILETS